MNQFGNEAQISGYIDGQLDLLDFKLGDEFNDEIRDVLDAFRNETFIDTADWRAAPINPSMPSGQNPFLLYQNLNSALMRVRVIEDLNLSMSDLSITEMNLIHMKGVLSELENPSYSNEYQDFLFGKVGHFTPTKLKELAKSKLRQISRAIVELEYYRKIALWGASELYNIQPAVQREMSPLDGSPEYIREELRSIFTQLESYKAYRQEAVIPLSLKHQKNIHGEYLCIDWGKGRSDHTKPDDRSMKVQIQSKDRLEPNYCDIFSDMHFCQIVEVGVQIVDRRSLDIDTTKYDKTLPDYWNLRIEAPSNENWEPHSTIVGGIAGSRLPQGVKWLANDSLTGTDPNGNWKVILDAESHRGTKFDEIRDVILWFRLSFLRFRPTK